MAELATIARPYAEALFQVAVHGDLKQAAEQLNAVAAVAVDPQVRQFADTQGQRRTGVRRDRCRRQGSAVQHGSEPAAHRDRQRPSGCVARVALQFHRLVNARSGVSDATVFSAFRSTQAS